MGGHLRKCAGEKKSEVLNGEEKRGEERRGEERRGEERRGEERSHFLLQFSMVNR